MVIAYTPGNVGLQNVTKIKGVHVTCCLISNRMTQTMRSHKNSNRPPLATKQFERYYCRLLQRMLNS
jgi:hypothetical protein